MTARKDMLVEGTNGASVSIKAGEKFTIVRAGSLGPDMFYIVRNITGEKKCSCLATKPCLHEIYVATGKPLAELRAEARAKSRKPKVAKQVAAPVVVEEPIIPMPAQEVVVATPVAVEAYQMSKGVRERLAAIAKPAEVAVEVAEPRKYYWCPNRCCYKWSDTNKVCDPQPDGKIWDKDICDWVMPPSGEPIDHQAELAAAGWKFAKKQIKDTGKALMLGEIAEIRERAAKTPDMMNAALTSNKAFSVLR
jgi:hypothetical protein